MDQRRYQGYRAVRAALKRQELGESPASVLDELAEGLLLARDDSEARKAVERVPGSLVLLVDRGELSSFAAHRFWTLLKTCAPRAGWPPSWQ
jgi:hypothetical protein